MNYLAYLYCKLGVVCGQVFQNERKLGNISQISVNTCDTLRGRWNTSQLQFVREQAHISGTDVHNDRLVAWQQRMKINGDILLEI